MMMPVFVVADGIQVLCAVLLCASKIDEPRKMAECEMSDQKIPDIAAATLIVD